MERTLTAEKPALACHSRVVRKDTFFEHDIICFEIPDNPAEAMRARMVAIAELNRRSEEEGWEIASQSSHDLIDQNVETKGILIYTLKREVRKEDLPAAI